MKYDSYALSTSTVDSKNLTSNYFTVSQRLFEITLNSLALVPRRFSNSRFPSRASHSTGLVIFHRPLISLRASVYAPERESEEEHW